MNMEATSARPSVRAVALSELRHLARIDAFVREHPEGQLFQRPLWLQAVARGCGRTGCSWSPSARANRRRRPGHADAVATVRPGAGVERVRRRRRAAGQRARGGRVSAE
jgi:hypothetical protein